MGNTVWRWVAGLLVVLLVAPAALAAQQSRPGYDGAAAFGIELRRLGVSKRVLMIGAHPDDENTQILSTLALGQGADVAYLSLTRGEGGQNGIGPELQEGLGLIRSEELLAARSLDGARQYFTRAYDYGYSRSADEAFSHWPREELLLDVVAVIRDFRPDVVISVFSGTERDGHGQHQAAGILAREAFALAAVGGRFPALDAAGLEPFQPSRLALALWGGVDDAHFVLPVGNLDPLVGRSHHQIAMASRGQHRSQDMARAEDPGPMSIRLQWIGDADDRATPPASLFAGIDTTLSQLAAVREPGAAASLLAYEGDLHEIRAGTVLLAPSRSAEPLASAREKLAAVGKAVADPILRRAVTEEMADVDSALRRAFGLQLRAETDASFEAIRAGGEFRLTLSLWNGGVDTLRLTELRPRLPEGWTAIPADASAEADGQPPVIEPGTLVEQTFDVKVPEHAAATRPYFLRQPREGDLYRWEEGRFVGVPFDPPGVVGLARVSPSGDAAVDLVLEQPAYALRVDPRMGESRRPLRVVPAVSVTLSPAAIVVPVPGTNDRPALPVRAELRAESRRGARGTLTLRAPVGWRVHPAALEIDLPGREAGAAGAGGVAVEVEVTPPVDFAAGAATLSARFTAADGTEYAEGYTLIDYPHIRPQPLYAPAEVAVYPVPVDVPGGLTVGFVPGAGDHAPAALRQLGVRVEELDGASLAAADLSRFDAILTGIRGYEVNEALRTHNQRLLDYARAGGTVVVQYNKYEYLDPGMAPLPVNIGRPHGRVTDEQAPVRLLEPGHQALSWPNRITRQDFDGWRHERGLYFLSEWDAAFTPLLEMSDEGEPPLRGGLLGKY